MHIESTLIRQRVSSHTVTCCHLSHNRSTPVHRIDVTLHIVTLVQTSADALGNVHSLAQVLSMR